MSDDDALHRRRCHALNRRGEPCKRPPLRGGDYCGAHDPDRPASTRFGSHEQAVAAGRLGGRPRVPTATELQRRLVEEHAWAVIRPHFRAIGLDIDKDGLVTELERGAIHVGRDKVGGVHASTVEDLGAQMQAAEQLLDRVFGRPRQALEHSGPEGGPIELDAGSIDLRKLNDDELAALQTIMAKAAPATADPQP